MAEERLIDDDLNKDKKYRIRKNAAGEDELYIDETPDGEDDTLDAVLFEVPELSEDDEDAAVLTPEQLAAREDARRREEEQKRLIAEECLAKAGELYAQGDFDGAMYNLNTAENTVGKNGEIISLKTKVVTRGFTDFSRYDDCAACADAVYFCCTPEQKAELLSLSAPLESEINKLEEKAAELHAEVETKKSERRAVFGKERAKSVKWFSFTVVPFIACLIVAIAYGSVMFAKQDGTNLIVAIVFAALALVFFVATLISSHKMWSAMRKYSLNEKNSSTRIGREYESLISDVKKLKNLLSAIKS